MSKLALLQKNLGYTFKNQKLLLQALTHSSFGNEFLFKVNPVERDNERLEFLGDAVLGLLIADLLVDEFSDANEGKLSKMSSALVNEQTLTRIAKNLNLQNHIRLGKGSVQARDKEKPSILSGTFEAILAAIYQDGGISAASAVIRRFFTKIIEQERDTLAFSDDKSYLQQLVQARWKVTPTYHVLRTSGPEHSKVFEVEVRVESRCLASACGNSKKEAEKNAAKLAIKAFS